MKLIGRLSILIALVSLLGACGQVCSCKCPNTCELESSSSTISSSPNPYVNF